MIKRFASILVFSILYFHSITILLPASEVILYKTIEKPFLSETYIKHIDLPSQKQIMAINAFQQFNNYADGKAVKYEGLRPVIVVESDFKDNPLLRGLATTTIVSCKIQIRKGLSLNKFKEVLLHEYVHCFGFEHVNTKCDLMYPTLYNCSNKQNHTKYANIIKVLLND